MNSCERCKTKGVRLFKILRRNPDGSVAELGKGGGIRFPEITGEPEKRHNSEWDEYRDEEQLAGPESKVNYS